MNYYFNIFNLYKKICQFYYIIIFRKITNILYVKFDVVKLIKLILAV